MDRRTHEEQQRDEVAVRDQELAAIYQHIPGIVFYVAIEPGGGFRFVSMSDAGLAATGLTRAQLAGCRMEEVIPPASRELVLSHYQEAIRSGRTVRWREVSVYPAGRRVGDVAVTPLYDAHGVATHLIGVVHDITDRERLEETLQQREARLRLALQACGEGSWTWDIAANSLDWDDGFRTRYGIAVDEPPTFEGWLARVHEDDRSEVLAGLNELLHTSRESWDCTFRIVRPDGSVRWIQSLGRAQRALNGSVTRLTGLELDVTAKRQADEELQARRDQAHARELQLLLETAAQGIVSVNAHGQIVTANRAFEAMFGWGTHKLIGHTIDRLVPGWLRDVHADDTAGDGGAPTPRRIGGLELVGHRRDGSTFPIEVSVNHVRTSTLGRTIAFVTDITERQRAVAALRERTAELERLTLQLRQMASELTLAERHAREQLAKTLHDGLQQQLVVAAMALEQVQHDLRMQRLDFEQLDEVKREVDGAIRTARSLSVELHPPLLHSEGLPAALTWLADSHRAKYGLQVRVTADPRADAARRDVRILLFESVRELLFNVVKHAGVDRVAVDLTVESPTMLGITVTDQGVGFDATDLLDRTKNRQLGWGLFSIRERLTLLGGRFEIDSRPGQGTRFHLSGPRAHDDLIRPDKLTRDAAGMGLTAAEAIDSASIPRLRILIVDDHSAVRTALRRALQAHAEFEVVGTAADGLDAISEARALQPDVVLMDISMPRLDGIETTRRLHREYPDMQILGLSMCAGVDARKAIEVAGAVGFYEKGVGTKPLIEQLLVLHATRPRQSAW